MSVMGQSVKFPDIRTMVIWTSIAPYASDISSCSARAAVPDFFRSVATSERVLIWYFYVGIDEAGRYAASHHRDKRVYHDADSSYKGHEGDHRILCTIEVEPQEPEGEYDDERCLRAYRG